MTTTLRILGWKAEGLRCADHEVDFRQGRDSPYPVSLIQMRNGTGKTTTLRLLRAALSGSLKEQRNSDAVGEFRRDGSDMGKFELRLEYNGRPLTLLMEFDFETRSVQYKTTGRDGQKSGFGPGRTLARFLNEKFVNFFVFDGELADDLRDPQKTDARKAMESLFQVDLLDLMKRSVEKYWERRTETETAKGQKGLTESQKRFQSWSARLESLKQEMNALGRNLKDVETRLELQKRKYGDEINKEKERGDRMTQARERVDALENEVNETTKSVLDNMRDPQALSPAFATALLDLKSGLDRVKLPESAAREWFEELSEEDRCVCGRPIDEDTRAVIRERARNYLGSDDVILLNRIKSDISGAVGASPSGPSEALSERLRELAGQSRRRQEAENDFFLLLREAEGDEAVKAAREERDRLARERDDILEKLRRYGDKDEKIPVDKLKSLDPKTVFSIRIAETAKDHFQKEVDQREKIRRLRAQRDILAGILERAYEKAERKIADEIRHETNERIARLMPYNDIRVKRIDGALLLQDKLSGSAGENVSVGYAFLATLFDRAEEHHLPFVVDSPVGSIDLDIRPRTGELLPKLAKQVIVFILGAERDRFVPSLEAASGGDVQYLTLFRKGISHLEERAAAVPATAETGNGFCVPGREFFVDFHDEDG